MAKYIAIPKLPRSVPGRIRGGSGASLEKRLETISRWRKSGLEDKRLHFPEKLIPQYEQSSERKIIATPAEQTPLSGVTIVECSAADAENLQHEMPNHEITEDFQLFLDETTMEDEPLHDDEIDRWHLESINLLQARTRGYEGVGANIGVGVLDTGIADIAELSGRIAGAYELNSEMKPVKIVTRDTHGHGTGVAALIAGKTVGVAPGADLTNFITIPGQQGDFSNFLIATEFMAARPEIRIVNISAGIRGWEPRVKAGIQALLNAGKLPVTAVGNGGEDSSRSPGNYSEVLSVGACNRRGRVWSSSGSETIDEVLPEYPVPDLVAPGERVTTCDGEGQFHNFYGSSLAAPIVSGIAALILERYETITDREISDLIFESCVTLDNAKPVRQGIGMVQVPVALWYSGV